MSPELRVSELMTLKTIAETLNQCSDLDTMLQTVLEKLLELTGLQAGWIFRVDRFPHFACLADHALPPGLVRDDKAPMKRGTCWCLDRFWDGRLKHAVNILNCKRLEDAVDYAWGDTNGISHHATIPLWAGDRMFGILNVAAPGKLHFSDEELALLQSVAYQIGTAVERTQLYQVEQKRAERFSRLGEMTRYFANVLETEQIARQSVERICRTFDWPAAAAFIQDQEKLFLRVSYVNGTLDTRGKAFTLKAAGAAGQAFKERKIVAFNEAAEEAKGKKTVPFPWAQSGIAVPVMLRKEPIGVFFVASEQPNYFDSVDVEVLNAYVDHLSLAYENARLYEQRKELARSEERNRLARDLHDSVSQMLFSLQLTARGLEGLLSNADPLALSALKDIQMLSQNALTEMRSLIMQLRPQGLEKGLVTGLTRYAESIGLELTSKVEGMKDVPGTVEEALWRIGQEALNNVRKHAGTRQAELRLESREGEIVMTVIDKGRGYCKEKRQAGNFGLSTMRERAAALGGFFAISGGRGKGTVVKVRIPTHAASDQQAGGQRIED
jgi:two-component system NarL family sensor kinase